MPSRLTDLDIPAILAQPLRGRVALVTGGATGIGAGISRALADAGAAVAIAHLDQHADAERLSEQIERDGGTCATYTGDLTSPDVPLSIVHHIADELGSVDILVNNAGAYPRLSWEQTTEAAWACAIEVNLTIHYRACRAVTAGMTAKRWGRIVNIGSVNTRVGRAGLVGYTSAKAGLHGLTRSLARELGPFGICVNTVLPGAIQVPAETSIPAADRTGPDTQVKRQCVPRRGQPEDVAAAVLFFASPAASFITGQSLHVDGGWLPH